MEVAEVVVAAEVEVEHEVVEGVELGEEGVACQSVSGGGSANKKMSFDD